MVLIKVLTMDNDGVNQGANYWIIMVLIKVLTMDNPVANYLLLVIIGDNY